MTEKKRAQEELIVAKEAAEQASRSKSAFLATMSHELRTPLNAVLGFSQLIREELADRQISDWDGDLEKIQRAGKHLLTLINGILDLSKIDAGRMDLQLEDFDPAAVVEEVAGTVRPLAAKNGNTLHLEVRRAIARGDRMRFQQCLLNLVGNACKFTHQGDIRIEARPETANATNWYSVRIVDTGIGIRPEEMTKLFADFSQVDASTTRKYGGTGLGLAISRRLSRLMGGEITVESEPGRGSTFTIRIPEAPPGLPAGDSRIGESLAL
jgi:signal transduction histidine kinase